MNFATRILAVTLPCAIAALAAVSVVTATGAAEPPAAPPAGVGAGVGAGAGAGAGAAPMQAAYVACRAQHLPSAASEAQSQRAQQHHRDRAGRSQRPAWVGQTNGDIERCLRGAPDTAQAQRDTARYARRDDASAP